MSIAPIRLVRQSCADDGARRTIWADPLSHLGDLLPGKAVTAMVFGKLPAHGDFVARGIAPDVQAEIDSWLAQEMARARTVHGAAFERLFDHAPVWRFSWAQGASSWFGDRKSVV